MGLKDLMDGNKILEIQLPESANVRDALNQLCTRYGRPLENRLFDSNRQLNRGITAFVNGCVIWAREGLDTPLHNGDELLIFPPVGGG